jgi:hypothetical protein
MDCMFINSFVRCRTPPRIYSLPYYRGIVPWTRSGEIINISVAVITALLRLKKKMQLYDTYVYCVCKLWACLRRDVVDVYSTSRRRLLFLIQDKK